MCRGGISHRENGVLDLRAFTRGFVCMARYSFVFFGFCIGGASCFSLALEIGRFFLFPRLSSFFTILVIYFPLVFLTEVSIRTSLC